MAKWEWNHTQDYGKNKNGVTRIEFVSDGFKEILTGDGVKSLVQSAAEKIAGEANQNLAGVESDGYETKVEIGGYGGGRYIAHVNATDAESNKAESEDKALTKAVHA